MIEKENCVRVGLVAKPHGVGGEVIVRAEVGFAADDLMYEFLLVEIDGGLVPYYVEEVRQKNQDEVIAKMQYCDNQEDARRLSGKAVYIDREWAEDVEADEQSTGMLIGYEAYDAKAGKLGTITAIDEQGGTNPLFVIERNGDELLVPIADDFIKEIDDEKRSITFCLPEGLVGINK